jgi:threonine dehydrogenase-like Zn-dependent dehydrogenase
VPWGLRRPVALSAFALLTLATLGFFAAVVLGAGPVGLLERIVAGAQALWPLAVVASVPRDR